MAEKPAREEFTLAELARRARVSPRMLQYRRADGTIAPDARGLYTTDDLATILRLKAEAEALRLRRAGLSQQQAEHWDLKAQGIELKRQALEARTAERAAALAVAEAEANAVVARLRSLPERQVEQVVLRAGVSREAAQAILEELARLALAAIGDLRAEVTEAIATL